MTRLIKAMMEMGIKGLSKTAGPDDIAFQAVFLIGPAGSGKSYVRSKRYLKYMRFRIIDPDEVKKTHPDYDPEAPFKLHDWSKEISNAKFKQIVESGTGEPVVVDGTGKKEGNIMKKAKIARANGYRIFLLYVYVPWEVSIFRNRNRARFVPEDVVLEQVRGVNKTFGILKNFVDKFKVIPNLTAADEAEAKADVAMYPPPQKNRPPRPGDPDYGVQQKAASENDEVVASLVEIARVMVAKELEAGQMETLSAKYAQYIVGAMRDNLGENFERGLENPKKVAWTVVRILGTYRGGKDNANYSSLKKYMPRKDADQEWADWWYNLNDARQYTVAKKALKAVTGVKAAEGDKCGEKGCIRKVEGGWGVMSGKTGKMWPQTFKSKEDAEDALKRYHGFGFKKSADADAAYKKRQKDIDKVMKGVHAELKRHAKMQKDNPKNWGFEGDLGHVYAELVDLHDFLKRA